MSTTTEPATEARLTKHGVPYELASDYELALIDRKRSADDAVRDVDPETVERYVADLEAGDPFPPLVVRRLRTRSVVLGGRHRLEALDRLGIATHPAYVVECDAGTALLLALDDNRTHGRTLTSAERREWALRLVDAGHRQREAARIVGIHESSVSNAVRARATREALVAHEIDVEALSASALARLSSLPDDEAVIVSVGRAAADGWIEGAALSKLVSQVNATPADERLDLVDREVVDAQERQGAKRRPSRPVSTGMSDDLARLMARCREVTDVPRHRLWGSDRAVAEARDVMRATVRWLMACDETIETR